MSSKIESGIVETFSKRKENIDILKKYIKSYISDEAIVNSSV